MTSSSIDSQAFGISPIGSWTVLEPRCNQFDFVLAKLVSSSASTPSALIVLGRERDTQSMTLTNWIDASDFLAAAPSDIRQEMCSATLKPKVLWIDTDGELAEFDLEMNRFSWTLAARYEEGGGAPGMGMGAVLLALDRPVWVKGLLGNATN